MVRTQRKICKFWNFWKFTKNIWFVFLTKKYCLLIEYERFKKKHKNQEIVSEKHYVIISWFHFFIQKETENTIVFIKIHILLVNVKSLEKKLKKLKKHVFFVFFLLFWQILLANVTGIVISEQVLISGQFSKNVKTKKKTYIETPFFLSFFEVKCSYPAKSWKN